MSTEITMNKINQTKASQLLLSTLNRSYDQDAFTEKEINKIKKNLKDSLIFNAIKEPTDYQLKTYMNMTEFKFRNIPIYIYENSDEDQFNDVAEKLSKFVLTLTVSDKIKFLMIDNVNMFLKFDKMDLHYLSCIFEDGFIFSVSSPHDATRLQTEMKNFICLNLSTIVSKTKEQFTTKNHKKLVNKDLLNTFYSNYSNIYNKFFILYLLSGNDIKINYDFMIASGNIDYIGRLCYELNILRKRFVNDKVRFLSSCVLPILNIEIAYNSKTYDVNTIFGFDDVIKTYFKNRKSMELTDIYNDDGIKFIFNLITTLYNDIISKRTLIKLPVQLYFILLLWYKYNLKNMSESFANFMTTIFNDSTDLTTKVPEAAIMYIFNIQDIDTFNADIKKILNIGNYNKYIQRKSIIYDSEDVLIASLAKKSKTRLQTHVFEDNYSSESIQTVFETITKTTQLNDGSKVFEKNATTIKSDLSSSSDEDQKIKIKNNSSLLIDESDITSSDSEDDSNNLFVRKLTLKKDLRDTRNKNVDNDDKSGSIESMKTKTSKRSLRTRTPSPIISDEKPTPPLSPMTSDSEHSIKDVVSNQNISEDDSQKPVNDEDIICDKKTDVSEDDNLSHASIDDFDQVEETMSSELLIVMKQHRILHKGACFYESVAAHLGQNHIDIMNNLKNKMMDKRFISHVDDLLIQNKCIMRLSGNEELVLKTLNIDSNGDSMMCDNLCFAAVSVMLNVNVAIVKENIIYCDQTGTYEQVVYILNTNNTAFDPIETINVNAFTLLNWDGAYVDIHNIEALKSEQADESEKDDEIESQSVQEELLSVEPVSETNDNNDSVTVDDLITKPDETKIIDQVDAVNTTDSINNDDGCDSDTTTVSIDEEMTECSKLINEQQGSLKFRDECENTLIADNKELAQSLTISEENEKKLKQELNDVSQHLDTFRKKIEELQEKNFELIDKNRDLMKQKETMQNSIDQIKKEMDEMRSQQEVFKKTLEENVKSVNILKEENNKILAENKSLKEENQKLKKEKNDNKKKCTDEILDMKRKNDKLTFDMREMEGKYEKRITDKDGFINTLLSEKTQVITEKVQIENKLKTTEKQLAERITVIENLEKEKEAVKQLHSKCQDTINSLNIENTTLKNLRDSCSKVLEEKKHEIITLNDALKKKTIECDNLISDNDSQKDLINQLNAKINDLEKSLKEKEKVVPCKKITNAKQFARYNIYAGDSYKEIQRQVKLHNERKAGQITTRQYYLQIDPTISFSKNVSDDFLLYYSDHLFTSDIQNQNDNYVVIKKKCPCKNSKTIEQWVNDGYVLNRQDYLMNTTVVCGCMVKPADVTDYIAFAHEYPIFSSVVSQALT